MVANRCALRHVAERSVYLVQTVFEQVSVATNIPYKRSYNELTNSFTTRINNVYSN
jgi:hypothetical protein